MKNVTITLPDDLARRARVAAAEQDKSLSRFIADLLEERCRPRPSPEEAAAKLEEFLNGPGFPGVSKAWKGREALYAEREDELLRRYDTARLRGRPVQSGKTTGRGGFAEGRRKSRYASPKPAKPK
jgi:hypothetical protein